MVQEPVTKAVAVEDVPVSVTLPEPAKPPSVPPSDVKPPQVTPAAQGSPGGDGTPPAPVNHDLEAIQTISAVVQMRQSIGFQPMCSPLHSACLTHSLHMAWLT